jgi:hypothetical protein
VSEVPVTVLIVSALNAVFRFAAVRTAPGRKQPCLSFLESQYIVVEHAEGSVVEDECGERSDRVNVTSCRSGNAW